MYKIKGDNDVTYFRRGTKPIEQTLDEKWFLWYSDDAELAEDLRMMEAARLNFTVLDAAEVIKAYISEKLYQEGAGIQNDLLQMSLDYTDWEHLAERLCMNFGVRTRKIPGDRFRS